MRQHAPVIEDTFDKNFGLAARVFARGKSCRDDAGVVEYQQIAGAQQCGKIGKAAIDARLTHIQQAARAALIHWKLGDQRFGQLKIKV